MPSNKEIAEYGFYFNFDSDETPDDGSHTFDDYGFRMDMPTYPTPTKKEILVDIPYSNGVLDFSQQDGGYHYEAMEMQYALWGQFATLSDMRSAQINLQNGLQEYNGLLSDDYIYPATMRVTCITVEWVTVDVTNLYLEAVVKFRLPTGSLIAV